MKNAESLAAVHTHTHTHTHNTVLVQKILEAFSYPKIKEK